MAGRRTHRVMMFAFADCQILDVTGPLQMLASANHYIPTGAAPYDAELVARAAGPLLSSSGLRLVADRALSTITDSDLRKVDTFMVAGGRGTSAVVEDEGQLAFVARAVELAGRVVSICTGSLILGAVGALRGRRATTHWGATDLLRESPGVIVEPDSIYVRDGKFWSSAGVAAGMDLAIALVEEDHGRAVALAVARENVIFMMRPGGQSQFSAELAAQVASGRTAPAVAYILANLHNDLRISVLASVTGVSERTLERAFREELKTTPAEFVQHARLDGARLRLSGSTESIERVAVRCGFSATETMRRAFQRRLGVSPSEYRSRFSTAQRPRVREIAVASHEGER